MPVNNHYYCVYTYEDRTVCCVTSKFLSEIKDEDVEVGSKLSVKWKQGGNMILYDGLVLSIQGNKTAANKKVNEFARLIQPIVSDDQKLSQFLKEIIKTEKQASHTSAPQPSTSQPSTSKPSTSQPVKKKPRTEAVSVTESSKAFKKKAFELLMQQYTNHMSEEMISDSEVGSSTEDELNVPMQDDHIQDVPSKEAPIKEVPSKEVPSRKVSNKEAPIKEVPSKEVNSKGFPVQAAKCPRTFTSVTCSECEAKDQEILFLKRKIQVLEEKQCNAADLNARRQSSRPRPGFLSKALAEEFKMIELVPGKGLFVYQDDKDGAHSQGAKSGLKKHTGTGTRDGPAMARFLMNRLWTRDEIVNGSLTNDVDDKLEQLNPNIVAVIIDFCAQNSKATRGQLRNTLWSKLTGARAKQKKKTNNLKTVNF